MLVYPCFFSRNKLKTQTVHLHFLVLSDKTSANSDNLFTFARKQLQFHFTKDNFMETIHSTQSLSTNSESQEQTDRQLIINTDGKQNLTTTAKWSNFLAIVGFVMVAFMALIGVAILLISPVAGDYEDFQAFEFISFSVLGILYIIIGVVYFFPSYFLLLFAKKTRNALKYDSQHNLNEGLSYLKKLAKFVGILTIISLALTLFIIPLAFLSAGLMQLFSGGVLA